MPEFTLSEKEAVNETRHALAGLSDDMIPDETVEQAVFLFAEPWVSNEISEEANDSDLEAAVIAYAAELSFDAWFAKSRMRDRSLEVFTQPQVWKEKLEKRTNQIFSTYGISRPPKQEHIIEVAYPSEQAREEAFEQ